MARKIQWLFVALLVFGLNGYMPEAKAQTNCPYVCATDCSGQVVAATCPSGRICCNNQTIPGTSTLSQTGTGSRYFNIEKIPGAERTDSFVVYLQQIYKFGIAIAAILAVFMIGVGAFQYIVTSAGNASKMGDGKDMIYSAIFGLILVMMTYLILYTINPDFLSGTLSGSQTSSGGGGGGSGGGGGGTNEVPNVPVGCNDNLNSALNTSASNYGIDPNIMRAIVKCGEGCSSNRGGSGECGHAQIMPRNRRVVCSQFGLNGTDADCLTMREHPDIDMNCMATMIRQEIIPRCGSDIRSIASCYNSGRDNNCHNTTNQYCDRVQNCN